MAQKNIRKLNELINPESFLQANTIKGFKYIDRAGELVNNYYKGNVQPRFQMSLQSLVFEQPTEKIEQLKISPQDIWAKFVEPDSLDMAMTHYEKEFKVICRILEIEKLNRIGWRNSFIYEFPSREDRIAYFGNLSKSELGNAINLKYEITVSTELRAVLTIEPVQKNDEKKTEAALFDIDVFSNKETSANDIITIFREMKKFLQSEEGFLKLLNSSFK